MARRLVRSGGGPARICYLGLTRWPNGPGDPRIFQKQLSALADAGYDVTALITGSGEPYRHKGVLIKPKGWKAEGLFSRCQFLGDVYRQGRQEKADCYFFGNFELLPVAMMLKWRTGARLVYDSMEHYPDMMRVSRRVSPSLLRQPLAIAVDAVERLSRRMMDLILTADRPTMCRFVRTRPTLVNFNFPPLQVLDTYDPSILEKLQDRYRGRRVLTYVGSMGWDRGLKELCEMMTLVRREFPNVVLHLLGGWQFMEWRRDFENLAKNMGLSDCIELHGPIPLEQLGAYLRVAEIGLAPLEASVKHEKNIPTKQFDYMCCGIPVIGNDLAPIRDFVLPAQAGLVVNTADPDTFAKAVIQLLRNPDEARRLGANGRRAIESGWNWERQATLLQAAFARILPSRFE